MHLPGAIHQDWSLSGTSYLSLAPPPTPNIKADESLEMTFDKGTRCACVHHYTCAGQMSAVEPFSSSSHPQIVQGNFSKVKTDRPSVLKKSQTSQPGWQTSLPEV